MALEITVDDAIFAGFFFGEGHIDLVKQGRTRSLSVRLRVALRSDDKPMLDWLVGKYGGCLSHRAATRSWCWQLTGQVRVKRALQILDAANVPSKKKREVEFALAALSISPRRGQHISDQAAQAMVDLKRRMIEARCYGAY